MTAKSKLSALKNCDVPILDMDLYHLNWREEEMQRKQQQYDEEDDKAAVTEVTAIKQFFLGL